MTVARKITHQQPAISMQLLTYLKKSINSEINEVEVLSHSAYSPDLAPLH